MNAHRNRLCFRALVIALVASIVPILWPPHQVHSQDVPAPKVPATINDMQQVDFDRAAVFDRIWETVQRDFYDANLHGVDWQQAKIDFEPEALQAETRDQFAQAIARMLGQLNASHTAYFPVTDPKRYQLLGIFEFLVKDPNDERLVYAGVGIDTVIIDNRVFVRSVFEGFPAADSGILFGDEILSVNNKPFHPMLSFDGKVGSIVTIAVRRTADGVPLEIPVRVVHINARTMFETALRASVRVIDAEASSKDGASDSLSIGYVHVWSYAGQKYHDLLKNELLYGSLVDCDALVLDLRDGWGGASVDYLRLFDKPLLEMESVTREGKRMKMTGVWGKPVTLLVNERSTSGKEVFTFGFKALGLGEVVGTTTAGAVLAGRPTLLPNGDVMYLAVSDVKVNGQRLEGIGVQPTIDIPRPIPFAAGADPQLDAAVQKFVKSLEQ
jgi:carboxyl-terminal processing protease